MLDDHQDHSIAGFSTASKELASWSLTSCGTAFEAC